MKTLLVKCPNCRKCYYETTAAFDPHKPPDGSMVRLKEPWRGWGWSSFGAGDDRWPKYAERAITRYPQMTCCACSAPLASHGRLLVVNPDGSEFSEEISHETPPSPPLKDITFYPCRHCEEQFDNALRRYWHERKDCEKRPES